MTAGNTLGDLASQIGPTTFVGYRQLEAQGSIVALLQGGRPVDSVAAGGHSELMSSSVSQPPPTWCACVGCNRLSRSPHGMTLLQGAQQVGSVVADLS